MPFLKTDSLTHRVVTQRAVTGRSLTQRRLTDGSAARPSGVLPWRDPGRGTRFVGPVAMTALSVFVGLLAGGLPAVHASDDQAAAISEDAQEATDGRTSILSAVERSLPYIAERGQWWIDRKKCISCHRTTFSIWAVSAAADAGLDVNDDQLQDWIDWSYDSLLTPDDDGNPVATKNLDGVAQLLFVTRGQSQKPERLAQRRQLAAFLQAGQQDDGSWSPAGQLPSQKRPKPETTWVTTGWADYYASAEELPAAHRERAAVFLKAQPPATSTERLLVEYLISPPAAQPQILQTLLQEQNEDGGWGWLRSQDSDAMATSQVLYALAHAAAATTSTERERAVQYLLSQQQEDGRWKVKGTKKNKQDRIEETSSYWGTCWAVIGLLESARQGTSGTETTAAVSPGP